MEQEPKLKHSIGSVVVPGDHLGRLVVSSTKGNKIRLVPGPGTYVWRNTDLYASLHGKIVAQEAVASSDDSLPLIQVSVASKTPKASDQVIRKDQTVLVRVVRLTHQQVVVEILANESSGLLRYPPEGIIRREDIHAGVQTEVVESSSVVTRAFRPGDIVVAKVLSLGDTRRYFLSTAEPSLGVIHATSSSTGKPLIPISWKEVEDVDTGKKEARKSARPPKMIPDHLRAKINSVSDVTMDDA